MTQSDHGHPNTPDQLAMLLESIDFLELRILPSNCLKSQGIDYVGELVQRTDNELLSIPNFGKKCLGEVKQALSNRGLKLNARHSADVLAQLNAKIAAAHASTDATPARLKLRFRRIHHAARLPVRASAGAACFDLHALSDSDGAPEGLPVEFVGASTFGTGLAVEVPPGFALMIYSRSGHGFKSDVRLANCVGVIDSDYRGEIMVRLTCDGPGPFTVKRGDRIAQAMLIPVPDVELIEVDALTETARGAGGLGSTGA